MRGTVNVSTGGAERSSRTGISVLDSANIVASWLSASTALFLEHRASIGIEGRFPV